MDNDNGKKALGKVGYIDGGDTRNHYREISPKHRRENPQRSSGG